MRLGREGRWAESRTERTSCWAGSWGRASPSLEVAVVAAPVRRSRRREEGRQGKNPPCMPDQVRGCKQRSAAEGLEDCLDPSEAYNQGAPVATTSQ